MAKAVALLLTTISAAIVILFFLLHSSEHNLLNSSETRRLGLQHSVDAQIFDPIVAKVREGDHLEEEEKQFVRGDGTVDARLRMMVLFPFLDRRPKDGKLEEKELEVWLAQQAVDRLFYRAKREMKDRDLDGDGAVSFSEYFPGVNQEDIDVNEKGHEEAGWYMQQFKNADVDRNGLLNLYEFRDFLFPEDSRNENIHRWMLREKIRNIDGDNDEKLNYDEFVRGIYSTYKNRLEYESSDGDYIPTPLEIFTKLDKDNDKLLGVEELKPLFRYLCPGELVYAKHYTIYLIDQADDNGDGKLTLEEMINHEGAFYNTFYDKGKSGNNSNGHRDEL